MTSRDEDKASEVHGQDSKEPEDKIKELEKYLDPLLGEFSKILSMVLGERMNLQFTSQDDKKKFLDAMNKALERGKEIELVSKSNLPDEEKLVEVLDLFDSMLRDIDPEMTKGQHFIDWLVSELETTIKKPASDLFFVATRYQDHVETVDRLLHECIRKGYYSQLKQFLEEAEKEEVAFSKSQVFLARLMPAYEFLHEIFPTTRTKLSLNPEFSTDVSCMLIAKNLISRKDIDVGLQYYRDFAGEFEKQVRTIVGLLRIRATGIKPDYREIKKRNLAVNLEELERREELRGLTMPFSKTIRNALSHPGYTVDPIEEKVSFVDRHNQVTMSYVEFLRNLAALSALVLALWYPRNNLILMMLRRASDVYRKARAKGEGEQSEK